MRRTSSTSGSRDGARLGRLAGAQRPVAVDDGALDLLQREARQAGRRPARLVEHVDEEIELGLAGRRAVLAMRAISRLASSVGQIAFGLGLIDDEVGEGFDEEVGPRRVLQGAGLVQPEQQFGLLGRDDAVDVQRALQPQNVDIPDAAATQRSRRSEATSTRPSAKPHIRDETPCRQSRDMRPYQMANGRPGAGHSDLPLARCCRAASTAAGSKKGAASRQPQGRLQMEDLLAHLLAEARQPPDPAPAVVLLVARCARRRCPASSRSCGARTCVR